MSEKAPDTIVLIHGLWMTPLAWEHWVADAAFARYLRGATDWQSKS